MPRHHHHRTCRRLALPACILAILLMPPLAGAEPAPRFVRQDAEWGGVIELDTAVTIAGCTVRVHPGTVIRLDAGDMGSAGPVIHLSSAGTDVTGPGGARCARLLLEGTASDPVVVESPAGRPAGAIVGAPFSCASLVARHTIFRRLGPINSADRADPSLLIPLTSDDGDLSLRNCRFEACGPVRGEFFSAHGSAEIVDCRFESTAGGTTLVFSGVGTGVKTVLGNRLDAGIRLECPQVLLRDNLLAGPAAAINVFRPTASGITIENNYVHNMSMRDEGQYALRTDAADTVVRGNILIGGTYVVETAPAKLVDNVLVGVAGLTAEIVLPAIGLKDLDTTTSTHHLIRALPDGAEVRRNLLLGPAYASLATGERGSEAMVEDNVFDGWMLAARAVQIDPSADHPVKLRLSGNLFARYRRPPVVALHQDPGSEVQAAGNRFVEVPQPAYASIAGLSEATDGGGTVLDASEAWHRPAATQAALELEPGLLAGETTVAEARGQWFAAYSDDR